MPASGEDEPTPDGRPPGGVSTAAGTADRETAPNDTAPHGGLALRAVAVWKTYGVDDDTRVDALAGVTVEFRRGQFTAIMGPSGSGKSTLMHCLAGLDVVTRGEVWIGETEVSALHDRGLTQLRREQVGFIFQQYNLLPTLSAEENITLPMSIAGRRPDREWMNLVVAMLGIGGSRAASSRRWRAPARWSRGPRWSLPTSQPAISTPARAARCCASCANRCASSARR
jgi:ABC-type ATPase involved in cell division